MGELEALEQRLSAAMERIGTGLSQMGMPATNAVSDSEVADLQSALDEERQANEDLRERLKAVRDRSGATIVQLEQKVARLQDQLTANERAAQELVTSNARLMQISQALREQISDGVVQADTVADTLQAELATLQAARTAEAAELSALLTELKPMVGEG